MVKTRVVGAWAALLLGCIADREMATSAGSGGEATTSGGSSGGSSETGAATSEVASTGTTDVATPTTGDSTSGSSSDFIVLADGPGVPECDPFVQDCAAGEKCVPYAEGGGSSWNALKCVPVTGDQLPGEPCTAVGGGVSGIDDCAKGALCWDVDAQGHGMCVEQCIGNEREPTCTDPKARCAVTGEGVLSICLAPCEPLIQDCAGGDLCLPVSDSYICVPDASGELGVAFDACEFADACNAGLLCLAPAAASECDQRAQGCCSPMCSIAAGAGLCPGVGQLCLPVFEPQPPGFEDVGYCSLM